MKKDKFQKKLLKCVLSWFLGVFKNKYVLLDINQLRPV